MFLFLFGKGFFLPLSAEVYSDKLLPQVPISHTSMHVFTIISTKYHESIQLAYDLKTKDICCARSSADNTVNLRFHTPDA